MNRFKAGGDWNIGVGIKNRRGSEAIGILNEVCVGKVRNGCWVRKQIVEKIALISINVVGTKSGDVEAFTIGSEDNLREEVRKG